MFGKALPAAIVLLAAFARADVNAALDALHDSGVNLQSLAANVALKTTDDVGDNTTKTGKFVLQKLPDDDTRLRATFTERRSGDKIFPEHRDYLLAGTQLIDRDYEGKKQTTTKVRDAGQKIDLFKLGQGPFPLPIGQTREDVLRDFTVEEEKTADPNAMAQLKLTPKDGTPLKKNFEWIRVTIDKTTKLPTVITTASPGEVDKTTATLTDVRTNAGVSDDEFKLDPLPTGWNQVGN